LLEVLAEVVLADLSEDAGGRRLAVSSHGFHQRPDIDVLGAISEVYEAPGLGE
jgi:hypothetical protein